MPEESPENPYRIVEEPPGGRSAMFPSGGEMIARCRGGGGGRRFKG